MEVSSNSSNNSSSNSRMWRVSWVSRMGFRVSSCLLLLNLVRVFNKIIIIIKEVLIIMVNRILRIILMVNRVVMNRKIFYSSLKSFVISASSIWRNRIRSI